jgi:hypothetical protein
MILELPVLTVLLLGWFAQLALGEENVTDQPIVDARTLHQKVLCGYQGWFRCPDDGTGDGWWHWSCRPNELVPATISVEMWPDTSEYADVDRHVVPRFSGPNGEPVYLFSSASQAVVQRHFEWMREYGLDGVFAQRFLVERKRKSLDTVLSNIRASAEATGRVYAICYDLTGMPEDHLAETLAQDWKRLVDDMKVTQDRRYLHHNGKPVLLVWGFYADRFSAATAHKVIDVFKNNDQCAATLIGGCHWKWRTETDAEWSRAFRRFDIISPWNVNNCTHIGGQRVARTDNWNDDLDEARQHGVEYLPTIFPGFGWTNLKVNRDGENAQKDTTPRRGGEFFWEQFVAASKLNIKMAYVTMFDEVDEATAIFKVTNKPPKQSPFQTYERLPSNWYLRLTSEGTKVIRGERQAGVTLPIRLDEKAD